MHRYLAPLALVVIVAGLTHSAHAEDKDKDAAKRIGDAYPLAIDPVTGQSLVDVKKPVIVLHDRRELHFANEDNVKLFNADPDTYLAKVDKLIIAEQMPLYPLDTCVVSGEKLGGDMGEPLDFVYGNRLVRFCCASCVKTFKDDPAKYLKLLDAAVIEKQLETYPLQTCLVSGEKFGDMGDPINYVIGNRLVRFCCGGCAGQFQKNPARFLARLDKHGEHREHAEHGGMHDDHHEGKHEDHDDNDDHGRHGGHDHDD